MLNYRYVLAGSLALLAVALVLTASTLIGGGNSSSTSNASSIQTVTEPGAETGAPRTTTSGRRAAAKPSPQAIYIARANAICARTIRVATKSATPIAQQLGVDSVYSDRSGELTDIAKIERHNAPLLATAARELQALPGPATLSANAAPSWKRLAAEVPVMYQFADDADTLRLHDTTAAASALVRDANALTLASAANDRTLTHLGFKTCGG